MALRYVAHNCGFDVMEGSLDRINSLIHEDYI